jgi:excisionase family DNA binding protein
MRAELQSVLENVRGMAPEQLPELLGELERIRATVLLKMTTPAPMRESDTLLAISAAAQRLGVSTDYLYRHANRLPFTRRMGRKLLFSAHGLESYIRQKKL